MIFPFLCLSFSVPVSDLGMFYEVYIESALLCGLICRIHTLIVPDVMSQESSTGKKI